MQPHAQNCTMYAVHRREAAGDAKRTNDTGVQPGNYHYRERVETPVGQCGGHDGHGFGGGEQGTDLKVELECVGEVGEARRERPRALHHVPEQTIPQHCG